MPYQDQSNIGRWRAAANGKRCRGNTWFIPYDTIKSREKDRPHPATFPPRLPEQCLRLARGAAPGHADRLLDRQPADGLDRDLDGADDGVEVVERAEARPARRGDAAALVVADVVDDVVDSRGPPVSLAPATMSGQARLSPMTLTPKSLPAFTTPLIVSSCARAMTTTWVAPARAIISASR